MLFRSQLAPMSEGDLKKEHVKEISKRLNVKEEEVVSMNRRLMGQEKSLNAKIGEGEDEWLDWLSDGSLDQELRVSQNQEMREKKELMNKAIDILNDREKEILTARRLSEDVVTLDKLKQKLLKNFKQQCLMLLNQITCFQKTN